MGQKSPYKGGRPIFPPKNDKPINVVKQTNRESEYWVIKSIISTFHTITHYVSDPSTQTDHRVPKYNRQ